MTEEINVGSVSVTVVPDARGFVPDLRSQILPAAEQLGREIAQRVSGPITAGIAKAVADGLGRSKASAAAGGASAGGAFADSFRARVEAALRDLPTPRIGLDATEADAELADVRARLSALSGVRVGVDIAAAEAVAQLDDLKARIAELGAKSPDVQVQVDAARAAAELAAVRAEVDGLDGRTAHVKVDVDTSAASSALGGIAAGAGGLGGDIPWWLGASPALVPVGAAATAGIAGVATAAASGAAGLGVLALGFASVSSAVDLLGKEHTAAAQAAAKSAAASTSAAAAQTAAANQVRSATAALSLARQTAAAQEIAATEAVDRAHAAETQANQQLAAAQRQVNDAREQAARDLESAANRAVDSQLASRQAAIDVTDAQSNYNATLSSGTATVTQRQQAALDLAKAQQALIEANEQAKQAEEDNNAAQKAGVKGAPSVVAAAQAVVAARHNQQQAGQSLADAERAQAIQRQQSAYTIEQAMNAVTAAQDAQTKAATASSGASSAAFLAVQTQLAKVNPAVLEFARYVTDKIEPAFNRLKTAAAAGLLPGVEAALKSVAPLLQPFTSFVSGLARTMGGLAAEAGKALNSPFWHEFFDYVAATAGPTLTTMGRVIGAVATGLAGLMQAFGPIVSDIGAAILKAAGGFASFGEHLSTNGRFQAFLAYIRREGPVVADLIGKVFEVIGKLLPILAPFGDLILKSLDVLATVLSKMTPAEILALGGALAAAFGGPVVQLAALAAGIAYAYDHSETFRKIVTTLARDVESVVLPVLKAFRDHWPEITKAIREVVTWITEHVGPTLRALADLFAAAVATIKDLWARFGDHLVAHIKVALSAIAEILSGAFKVIQGILEIATGILTGKWGKVWTGIKDIVDGVWKIIQGVVRDALNLVSTIIGAGMALISEIWSRVWALLKTPVTALWSTVKTGANDVVGFFEKMPGRIANATVGMWDGIGDAFKATINTIIGWWDGFVSHLKIPGFTLDTHILGVPTAHFGGLDIGGSLKIPFLAQGGVATAARLAVHGEAGDEAILPLTDARAMRKIADAIGGGQHGGLTIGELNVSAAKDERAEVTVPRALRQYAYTAGLWDLG